MSNVFDFKTVLMTPWVDHIRSTRERLGRLLGTYESRFKSQTTEERG